MVTQFENEIAAYFGAPYSVAVDSCTHGIELCLRLLGAKKITVPNRTYLSVPMLAEKLGIEREWVDLNWTDYYEVHPNVYDAAVLWRANSYIDGAFMCISFQYQKHLSLGRGGAILCATKENYEALKKMSYDGRLPDIPWREQDIQTMGYHYYMTPETAANGLERLPTAISTEPRKWVITDWPDLTQLTVFK